MTIQERLLEAVGQKLLRPIDAQFALTVAGNDDPAVTLAQRCLVMTQVKVTCVCRCRV